MIQCIQKINPATISKRHLDQLVHLASSVGFFEYAVMHNKLNLRNHDMVQKAFIKPYLPYTKIIIDDLDNITGNFVAFTNEQNLEIDLPVNWEREDVSIKLFNEAAKQLNKDIAKTNYILQHFAVRFDLQGIIHPKYSRKISDLMFENVLENAKEKNCDSIALIVWAKNSPAIKFYTSYGCKVINSIDLRQSIFTDELLLMKTN
jgi:hypothetical protein